MITPSFIKIQQKPLITFFYVCEMPIVLNASKALGIFTIVVHKRYHHTEPGHFQDRFITRSVSINNKNYGGNNEVMILTYHRKQPGVERGPSLCTARLTSQMARKLTATYSLLWPIANCIC